MKDLNLIAKEIHDNAVSKGFWDNERNEGEVLMLIVSELSEAMEADRKGRRADLKTFYDESFEEQSEPFTELFRHYIKDSFEDELADTVIRIFDWMHFKGMEISENILDGEVDGIYQNTAQNLFLITSLIVRSSQDAFTERYYFLRALSMLFAIAKQKDFDLVKHIELKMKYNSMREHMHGKAY